MKQGDYVRLTEINAFSADQSGSNVISLEKKKAWVINKTALVVSQFDNSLKNNSWANVYDDNKECYTVSYDSLVPYQKQKKAILLLK